MSGFESSPAFAGAGGRVLDFRRRPLPPRRRKRSVWLSLARPLTTALALTALPGGLAAWVLTSSRFALHDRRVEGSHRVPAGEMRRSLSPLVGENLVRLPLSRVESLLAGQPWIESVEIEKTLPDRVRVSIHERRPVALLAGPGNALTWADAKGHPIAPVAPGESTEGFLVVDLTGATGATPGNAAGPAVPEALDRALAAARELQRANPDWARSLLRVDVLGEEDLRLHARDLPFPLLVRQGDLAAKIQRFEALLPELGRRYTALEVVDLRFARRIIIQPKPFTNGGTG